MIFNREKVMLKEYLLWYKENKDSKEVIVCVSRSYHSAERQAEQLHFELTCIEKKSVYEIGIAKITLNKVYLDFLSTGESWVVYQGGEWFLDE